MKTMESEHQDFEKASSSKTVSELQGQLTTQEPLKRSTGKKHKKSKSRSKAKLDTNFHSQNSILQEISNLEDDIVKSDSSIFATSGQSPLWHTNINNQPTGRLFIEFGGAFRPIDKQKLKDSRQNSVVSASQNELVQKGPAGVQKAVALHIRIQRLATYCHGVLAGFALWQCVMVYQLGPPTFTILDFVEHYAAMAVAAQAMFYLLTSFCIFSLLGSCNIGGDNDNLMQQILNFHSGIIALIIYFVTLILSLSIASGDDWLAGSYHNSTAAMAEEHKNKIQTWKNVNLFRCLGAILAWLVLSIRPNHNYMCDYFKNLIFESSSHT